MKPQQKIYQQTNVAVEWLELLILIREVPVKISIPIQAVLTNFYVIVLSSAK
jgi:hypothetical protein